MLVYVAPRYTCSRHNPLGWRSTSYITKVTRNKKAGHVYTSRGADRDRFYKTNLYDNLRSKYSGDKEWLYAKKWLYITDSGNRHNLGSNGNRFTVDSFHCREAVVFSSYFYTRLERTLGRSIRREVT